MQFYWNVFDKCGICIIVDTTHKYYSVMKEIFWIIMLFNNFISFHIVSRFWNRNSLIEIKITYSGTKIGLLTSYNTFLSITYGFSSIVDTCQSLPELPVDWPNKTSQVQCNIRFTKDSLDLTSLSITKDYLMDISLYCD